VLQTTFNEARAQRIVAGVREAPQCKDAWPPEGVRWCVCVCDSVRVGSKRRVKHAPPAWRARAAVTKRFKRVAIARAAVIVESVRSSTLAWPAARSGRRRAAAAAADVAAFDRQAPSPPLQPSAKSLDRDNNLEHGAAVNPATAEPQSNTDC